MLPGERLGSRLVEATSAPTWAWVWSTWNPPEGQKFKKKNGLPGFWRLPSGPRPEGQFQSKMVLQHPHVSGFEATFFQGCCTSKKESRPAAQLRRSPYPLKAMVVEHNGLIPKWDSHPHYHLTFPWYQRKWNQTLFFSMCKTQRQKKNRDLCTSHVCGAKDIQPRGPSCCSSESAKTPSLLRGTISQNRARGFPNNAQGSMLALGT